MSITPVLPTPRVLALKDDQSRDQYPHVATFNISKNTEGQNPYSSTSEICSGQTYAGRMQCKEDLEYVENVLVYSMGYQGGHI